MCKVIQLVKCKAGNKLVREQDSFTCEICDNTFSRDLMWFDEASGLEYCDLCFGVACDLVTDLEDFAL